MKRLRYWLRHPEIIGAPDCPIIRRWTIIDSKPATVSPSSNEDNGDSFFRHKIVALIELPKWLTRDRKLMVHFFEPNVEDRDPHDHPRGFWTFVLRGRYFDLVPCPGCDGAGKVWLRVHGIETTCLRCRGEKLVVGDVMKPGTLRYRPAEHTHITQAGSKGAWTVVLMGPLERGWGFWREGGWWPWRKYEEAFGFAMRCPTDEEREGRMLKYGDDGVTVKDVGDVARAKGFAVSSSPATTDHVVRKAAPVGLSRPDLAIPPPPPNLPDCDVCDNGRALRVGHGCPACDRFHQKAPETELWRSPRTGIVWALPSFSARSLARLVDPIENARAAARIHREREKEREEAFRDLAEVAYGSRDAIWTSPRTLVKTALEKARKESPDA